MAALVIQLLELSRAENAPVPTEHIDFSRIVAREILSSEAAAYEKNLTLSGESVDEHIYVRGNTTQLRHLTAILLENAIDHSEKDGDIEISLSAKHGKAVLLVSNRGKEIPPEQQNLIFERFYRLDPCRKAGDNHYGLGLAIAKAIVTSLSGTIEVSCHEDRVIFTVTLPIK
ncbi:MAG: sensor histidine kinase [Clostridiales bacterium]|nr:sensor histidine kinase [Clostridiales bacterium]